MTLKKWWRAIPVLPVVFLPASYEAVLRHSFRNALFHQWLMASFMGGECRTTKLQELIKRDPHCSGRCGVVMSPVMLVKLRQALRSGWRSCRTVLLVDVTALPS
jgi:hypothetical protein